MKASLNSILKKLHETTQCCVVWMVSSTLKVPWTLWSYPVSVKASYSHMIPITMPLSKAGWGSLATLLSQLQHDLIPNLGNWIIFLSEVLATIITIPRSCPFLEINCYRKLCFLLQHIFPNFIALHGGEEADVASQHNSLQTTWLFRPEEQWTYTIQKSPLFWQAKNVTNLY